MKTCSTFGDYFDGFAGYFGHTVFIDVTHCEYMNAGFMNDTSFAGVNVTDTNQDNLIGIQLWVEAKYSRQIRMALRATLAIPCSSMSRIVNT